MSPLIQHTIALTLVAGCLTFLLFQVLSTLRTGKGKLGSCCSKGCSAGEPPKSGAQTPDETKNGSKPGTGRVVFLPVELLGRRK